MKEDETFATEIWDKMNIYLGIAMALTTIIFIVLFIFSFVKSAGTTEHSFILGMCGVFASLASAFFIAWVMRVYDLNNKRKQELKALTLLRPYLIKILTTINGFFPQLKSFVIVKQDDTVMYPRKIVYYTDPNMNVENRSFIDFDLAFQNAKIKLDSDLSDCLNAPVLFQCNERIVNLLTSLKLNELTQNLYEIQKSASDPAFPNISFMGLHKNLSEFATFYETLSEVAKIQPINGYRELSESEKRCIS